PTATGRTFHVYSGVFVSPDTLAPVVKLDADREDGFGPETITIRRQFAGSYCFGVTNVSRDAPLGASGARVRVFRGGEEVAAFSAPAPATDAWYVFRMSGAAITPLDSASAVAPDGCP
ncbi:MAG TPA: hypothetical protein VFR81_11155, partial [Longimicrobium sp.]|nr:hypothetical protein [Longimicrobium sp.]